MLRVFLSVLLLAGLSGCRIENVGPAGVTATRPVYVNQRDVQVFRSFKEVPGHYTVIDAIWVDDDGNTPSDKLVWQLRVIAGGRGANAIVLDGLNRDDGRSGVAVGFSLDDSPTANATAIWIGDGLPPERKLR